MANRLTWISISTAHDSKSVNFLSLYASIYHIHPCDLADSEELHHWVETVVSICILLFKLQTIWVTSPLALNNPLYIPNTVLLTCKLWWHSGWLSGSWHSGWHSGSWHLNFNLHSAYDSKSVNFLSLCASIYHSHPYDLHLVSWLWGTPSLGGDGSEQTLW